MPTATENLPTAGPATDTVELSGPCHRHTRRCWWNHDLARWVCPTPESAQR